MLLQVLDDGRITDSQGRTVDFKNTILIMTSNIGSQYLLEGIQEDGTISQQAQDLVQNDLRAHFRPEFLNRLDEIILFKPLTKDNMAKQFVIDGGYDPVYGARPLKRFVQKYVETLSARLILGGNVGQGDTILLTVQEGKLTAVVKPEAEVVE